MVKLFDEKEFTDYEQESIEYNGNIYRGCKSPDLLITIMEYF